MKPFRGTFDLALKLAACRWIGPLVAIAGVSIAAFIRWEIGTLVGPGVPPLVAFYPVVILTALLAGTPSALLATALSAIVVDYLFLEPVFGFGVSNLADVVGLTLFLFINVVMAVIGGSLRKARHRIVEEMRQTKASSEELRRQLDALSRSEQRFRTLTELSAHVVWISSATGEPAGDSPSWREYTGRTEEQWRGWNWLEAIHPDERQRVAGNWRTALEQLRSYHDEYRLLHASGVYRNVQCRAVPVINPDGTVREWIGVLTDITSAKRADAARNILASIIADSDDAVLAKDLDGVITSWNRSCERLFGYTAEQMIGRNVRVIVPPDRHGEESHILAAIARGQKIDHYESQRITRDGRILDVSITTSPVYDTTGRVIGASTIARDITERKRQEADLHQSREALRQAQAELQIANAELQRANAELEQRVKERTAELEESVGDLEHFSYTIAHDMRAPLRAMQGFTQLLLADGAAQSLSAEGKAHLNRISQAARRMDMLITDALQYSRLMRSSLPLRPVDVGVLLHGIVDNYPNLQPPRATVRLEGDFPRVLGNEAGLTQCFSNLLDNAVKFVADGVHPEVLVWAERDGDSVQIWFRDNGVGIAPEYQDRIWDLFQRLEKRREGTGIGLALVRKVISRMGGTVGVASKPGEGSQFWVDLRAADAAAAPDDRPLRHSDGAVSG